MTRLGTMLSVASRHVAIQSRVVEAELRMIDSKARVGGAEWDAISVFGTFSTNAIEAVRSASDELAVKRALVFRQIMSLLSIGRDRLEVRDYLAAAFCVFRFELTIDVVHPSSDPDLLIAEYHGRGRALATSRPYDNRYVGFWWFRGDAICRTREYYDQGVADAALAP